MSNINNELMQNPDKAFELAFFINPKFKKVVNDYQFVWATSNELQFKNIYNRQTLHVPYDSDLLKWIAQAPKNLSLSGSKVSDYNGEKQLKLFFKLQEKSFCDCNLTETDEPF